MALMMLQCSVHCQRRPARHHGFVYTTDLLPQGKYEVEHGEMSARHMAVGEFQRARGAHGVRIWSQ